MKKTIHTVIFDLGGVLIDWNPRYLYRILGIRATGVLDLKTPKGTASITYRNYTLIEQGDGYA